MIKNPRLIDGTEVKPVSLSIDLNITPVSTANMMLPAGQTIDPRTYVELFILSGSIGFFRTRAPSLGAAQNSSISLDHAIAEVGDYVIANDIEQDTTVSSAMQSIWTNYKGTIWQLGSIASGSTSVIYKANYDSVLDAMLGILEQVPSLMLAYDFTTSPWTVSVVAKESSVSAEGRLSRNVKSAAVTVDDSQLCTRVYMEHLPGTDGNVYGHIDADTIETYGIVEIELPGAETEAQATLMANTYLAKHKHPQYSVQIEAVDLSRITGEPLDSFAIGRKYRLALPDYGVSVEETITQIRYSNVYNNPNAISITLAEDADTVINYIRKASKSSASNSKAIEKKSKEFLTRFDQTDNYISAWAAATTGNGEILRQAGIYLDNNGILQYATDNEKNIASRIEQTADGIRTDVSAANTAIYTHIRNTASGIEQLIVNTESGLRNYTLETASGIHSLMVSTTNQVWIQEADPSTAAGGSHTVKVGDVWIESTHQGTWDGAEGFDWDHDEQYDWNQIQGAKVWGWQNGRWELVSDQQQVVSYRDVVDTADQYVRRYVAGIVNDEGLVEIYLARLEMTAQELRSDISAASSTIYTSIRQTATNILLQAGERPRTVVSKTQPTSIDGRGLKEDDVWIESEGAHNWEDLENADWSDESSIDWNKLRSDIIHVYRNGKWQVALDGTTLLEDADVEVDKKRARMYARKLDTVDGQVQQHYAELKVEAERIQSRVSEYYSGLQTSITQTAREINISASAARSELYSTISVTATSIISTVGGTDGKGGWIGSAITQTSTNIYTSVAAAKSAVYTAIDVSATGILNKVGGMDGKGGWIESAINQTSTNIFLSVEAAKTGVYSAINISATGILSTVGGSNGKGGWIKSVIDQTATSIAISVEDSKTNAYSLIQVAATGILSTVGGSNGKGGWIKSVINQTATSIAISVNDSKTNAYALIQVAATGILNTVGGTDGKGGWIKSVINQTSTNIHVSVAGAKTDVYSAIDVEKNRISLVVSGTGNNATVKRAAIVAAINEDSSSTVIISADKINLNGYVKASQLTTTYFKSQIGDIDEVVMLNANVTGNLKIRNGSGQQQAVDAGIWSLRITQDGDTYTLQRKRFSDSDWVDIGTFSRATSLSGAWSSNTLTVTAKPQNKTYAVAIGARFRTVGGVYYVEATRTRSGTTEAISGTSTTITLFRNGNTVEVRSGGTQVTGSPTLTLTSHTNSVAGLTRAMVNSTPIHGKLYYKDGSVYKEVVGSDQYWYYKSANSALTTYYS